MHSRTALPGERSAALRGAACLGRAARSPRRFPKPPGAALASVRRGSAGPRCARWSIFCWCAAGRWFAVRSGLDRSRGDCNAQTLTRSQVRNPRHRRPSSRPARATRPSDCRPLRTREAEIFSLRAAARTRPARRAAEPPLLTQSHSGTCPKVLA